MEFEKIEKSEGVTLYLGDYTPSLSKQKGKKIHGRVAVVSRCQDMGTLWNIAPGRVYYEASLDMDFKSSEEIKILDPGKTLRNDLYFKEFATKEEAEGYVEEALKNL